MRPLRLLFLTATFAACSINLSAQVLIVVHDPTKSAETAEPNKTEQAILDRDVLPAVRKKISYEVCGESLQGAGVARGSFTIAGAKQTLIFYQYCQTGNGFGWNGLILIDGGKIIGNFVSEGGWAVDIGPVEDINKNGVDEFTLAYSGGLHQGMGGTGVDLMEFSSGMPRGIGWYKAEEFGPTEAVTSWKLSAKAGKTPVFYKQKYFSGEGRKPKPVGRNGVTKLGATFVSKFEAVK